VFKVGVLSSQNEAVSISTMACIFFGGMDIAALGFVRCLLRLRLAGRMADSRSIGWSHCITLSRLQLR
jgi:hypothetical protein